MRTTITLENDVFEAAKSLAASSGQNLGKIISQLARRGLRSPAAVAKKNGFPVFEVSSETPIIPSDRASKLLADDLS